MKKPILFLISVILLKLVVGFAIGYIIISLAGCRTKKDSMLPAAPVVLNNNDSTSVKVVYEQTPADSAWLKAYFKCDSNNKVIMSLYNSGSTTGLQNNTSFENGMLISKTTKPADSIRHDVIVRVIGRSYAVPQPYPVYLEKELTKWQSFKIVLGEIFMIIIGAALLFGGFKLYKKFV